MQEILGRMSEFDFVDIFVFPDETILNVPVEDWPICDCLISFYSKGFPLEKAIEYAKLRKPFSLNDLEMQYVLMDRFVIIIPWLRKEDSKILLRGQHKISDTCIN